MNKPSIWTFIKIPNNANTPRMNNTSWIVAKIAAIAKSNWNLNVKYATIPKHAKLNAIKEFLNNSLPSVGPIELVDKSSAFLYSDFNTEVIFSETELTSSELTNFVLTEIISFVVDFETESLALIICNDGFSIPFVCKFSLNKDRPLLSTFWSIPNWKTVPPV